MEQPPVMVLIDDADNFVGLSMSRTMEMENLLPKATELGIGIMATSLMTRLRGFDGVTRFFREAQTSLLFGTVQDQNLFQFLPPRGYKPAQDTGIWYSRGDVSLAKLPLAPNL